MGDKVPKQRSIARVAARQHGVVTVRQLLDVGFSRQEISRRVATGVLHRAHRGVYHVGHRAPNIEATYMAAVLACGPGSALSGQAAAFLYRLIKGASPVAEVSTVRDRRLPRVVIRQVTRLDRRDVTTHRRIPVTTIARTVVDLAAGMTLDDFGRICHEAEVRFRLRPETVGAALERRPRSPGAWKLREVFEGEFRITLSVLERAFLALLRARGLPLPRTNGSVGGRYVDCRWPDHRLTVELDSYRYHHTRHAWEQDRRRERQARARGDEFRRYTYGDVTEDAELVVTELRQLLGAVAT